MPNMTVRLAGAWGIRGFVESVSIEPVMQGFARNTRHPMEEIRALEEQIRLGGGTQKIEKQHREGKWTARERIDKLVDRGTLFLEIGLLIAYDRYKGQAP